MKHKGSCLCGQFQCESDLDPILIIQCNCMNCRKLSGSYQLGYLYAVSEIMQSGETGTYQFAGGSGYLNAAHFCKNCNVRCKTHPAPEVMEGMVGIPLELFDTAKDLSPKAQIWTSEKLPFLEKDVCISKSFEYSGIAQRLIAMLKRRKIA